MSEAQIVFINGGMTFKEREDYLDYLRNREVSLEGEKKWYKGDYLEKNLDQEVYEIEMPCRDNADYEEWRINFGNYLPLLSDRVVFIGLSLGATFLAKYLSENQVSKEIVSAYLIAPPYDDDIPEDLAGGFQLGEDLSLLEENCENLTLMFSEDDEVVPVRHAEKFREKLTNAEIVTYESKGGHFQVEEFPELVQKIQNQME
jgi:predicted alpha/beta hydrolase family esterase